MVATWPIRRRMGQVTWSTPVPMVTNAPNGKRQDSEWRGSTCWCARRRIAAWRSRSSSCRFPREMRPVPLNLRPCSADPAPTPQNRLSTRRLRTQDVGIGGTFCRIGAPRAEHGRISRGIAPPRTPSIGASRVETYTQDVRWIVTVDGSFNVRFPLNDRAVFCLPQLCFWLSECDVLHPCRQHVSPHLPDSGPPARARV